MVCKDPEHITPLQRLFAGAMSGAVAQVRNCLAPLLEIPIDPQYGTELPLSNLKDPRAMSAYI